MKEIFVFGAGASHASTRGGTPLGKDLVWTYHPDCALLSAMGSNGQPTPDSVKVEQNHSADLQSFLKSRSEFNKYADQLNRDIKTAMVSSFNVEKKYYIDELMKDLTKTGDGEAARIIQLIKRLIVRHIVESSLGRGNDLYEKFVQSLSGKSSDEVCVISMNFDCLLHEDFKKGIYFYYLLDFKKIDPNRKSYQKDGGLPLIKLNGSLDWEFDSRENEINLRHWHIGEETYYPCDGQANSSTGTEPYIFLPHQTKDKLTKMLWDKAGEALKHADKITIIGYSFPDYDKDVIELFRQNVNAKMEWDVIDKPENSKEQDALQNKYKELFPNIPNERINFDSGGFEEYINTA